jgi:hypothetical protein
MQPNLVGPAGMQLQPQQLDSIESGHHPGIGSGGTAAGRDRHPLSVLRVPSHRCLDGEWTGIEMPPRQGGIRSADPASGNSGPQPPMGQIGLGHDHETRGIAIEPMNDAGPSFRSTGQGSAASHQRVDQRVVPVARSRVNHQSSGLIDDGKVLVLVDQDEGNGTGLKGSGRLVLGELNQDLLASSEQS